EGGCTKPGCTIGAYGCQVHHVTADWVDGGNTNVNDLGLACGPDNRAVSDGGWATQMNQRCEVEWTPPPPLDTGQARVNTYHRPELLLRPEPEPDNDTATATDAAASMESAATDTDTADQATEPGGPAPPDNQAA
ncbi:HNH endonuclease signature motif containing protein, partial [Mycolicibacterium sp. BiH015]|uniref:HNH endonuclease signature motif containing protein n=1 Tax=Mycolicibacterium sp. BiH015 TaxID=3018808 RepID=UPI0022E79CD4